MNSAEIACPKCHGSPKAVYSSGEAFNTHICHQECGFIYWTLSLCSHCDQPQKTVILKKPNYGQKISCNNCKKSTFFFRCPNVTCRKFFFRDQHNYRMGQLIKCEQCKLEYKTITCPCGGQVPIDKDITIFQGFSSNKCWCGRNLIYTICPSCKQPEFHLEKLEIGQRIRCTKCKIWRKYVPCPSCGLSLGGQNYSFFQPTHCQKCNIHFQYCKCPYGCPAVSFNVLTKKMGPQRKCYDCKNPYFVVNCKKCRNTLYQQIMNQGQAIIDNCPHCKNQMQYYLCLCGVFNDQGTSCTNKNCPKAKQITDNTKRNQAQKKKNESRAEKEDVQCKLCYNARSEYINQVCGHILMCQECVSSYSKSKKTDSLPCPVCKTIGRYYKYRTPIYS